MDQSVFIDPKSIRTRYSDVLSDIFKNFEESVSSNVSSWEKVDYFEVVPTPQFEQVLMMKNQIRSPKTALVLLIDLSGSMYGERIDGFKIALQPFLKNQDVFDRIALYGFNSKLIKLQPLEDNKMVLQEKAIDALKPDGKTAISTSVLEVLEEIITWVDTEKEKRNNTIFESNLAVQLSIVTDALSEELFEANDQLSNDWMAIRVKMSFISKKLRGLLFTKIFSCSGEDQPVKILSRAFETDIYKVHPADLFLQFEKIKTNQDYWNKKRKQYNSISDQNMFSVEVLDLVRDLEVAISMLERIIAILSGKENPQQLDKHSAAYEKRRKEITSAFQEFYLSRGLLFEEHESKAVNFFQKNSTLIKDAMKESGRTDSLIEKVRIKEQLRFKQLDQNEIEEIIRALRKNYAACLRKSKIYY